jgi:CHAT domain-containing protein
MSALERVASYYLDKASPRWSFAFYYSDFGRITAMLKDKTRPIALLKRLRKLGEKHGRPLFALLADKRLALTRRMIESTKGFESEGVGKWTADDAKAKSEPAFAYKPLMILHTSPKEDDLTVKEKDLINLLSFLADGDFIPVRDRDPRFKGEAFLETVTKNGTVNSISLRSATIPSLIKFFNKVLLEFHRTETFPRIVRSDAYSLKYLGKTYARTARKELAELFYRKFIEIAPKAHQIIMTKRDLVDLAMTKAEERRRLIEVLPEAMANVDKCVTCPMYVLIGLMENSSGTPDARKWLDKAAKFEKEHASRDKNLRYYFNIFTTKEKLHRMLLAGNIREAREFVKKLREKLEKEPDFWGKGTFFSEIELELGEFKLYDCSINFALAGARAYENCGRLDDAARLYHNLGVQYGNTGMTDNAKDAYAQALRLGKIINDKHRVGDVLRELAGLLNDDKKSLALLEKSRAYLSAAFAFPCLINTLKDLTRKKADMGLFKEAKISLDELRRTTELWGNENPYLNAKAHLLKKEGKFDQAISLLEKMLADKGDKLTPLVMDRVLAMLANTCYDAKRYPEALKWYERRIAEFEHSRELLSTQERKAALSSKNFNTYEYAFDCAARCKNERKAFDIMEKSRARAYLDLLAEKIAKGEITVSHDANEFVDSKSSAPAAAGDNPLLAINPKLRGVSRDLEVVVKNPPKTLLSLVSAKPGNLRDFQKKLPETLLVVEYFTTRMKSHIWLVTRRKATLIPVDISYAELAKLARKWLDQLQNPPLSGERTKTEKRVYELLWAPVAKLAESKKIVVIPHRVLHSLPFHAMRNEKGRFLCETREIIRCTSATLLEILAARRRKSNKTIAFGNPLVESGFELPRSEKEARNAASHFESETFLRGDATETALKTRSPDAGVIHLACHAFFDKYSPLDSFALLARDEENDGMLKTAEIFNLRLRENPLVVLSACKSAKGSSSDGDDLIGLSSAFFCAGASEIIATLWSVDDKATERVMRSFYRHFAKSRNAGKALTAMRRDMIKKKMPLRNWAPFVLLGGGAQTHNSKTTVYHLKTIKNVESD